MKLPEGVIEGALRIGIGKFTTGEEIEKAGEIISTAINQVRLIPIPVNEIDNQEQVYKLKSSVGTAFF
jgi:hypothetical protein